MHFAHHWHYLLHNLSHFLSAVVINNSNMDDLSSIASLSMDNCNDDNNQGLWWSSSTELSFDEIMKDLSGNETIPQTPPTIMLPLNNNQTTKVQSLDLKAVSTSQGSNKKSYKCYCPIQYPQVWRINSSSKIKVCKTCKKARFTVQCNANKHCKSCSRVQKPYECEISLKFRKDQINNPSFGDKKSILCMHVLQNVFQKFKVAPSCKKMKISSMKSTSDNKTYLLKGSLEMFVTLNEDKLPFSWKELKGMKRIHDTQQ